MLNEQRQKTDRKTDQQTKFASTLNTLFIFFTTGLTVGMSLMTSLASAQADAGPYSPLLKKIESIYQPLAKREGGTLTIEINAQDPLASASAHREPLNDFRVRLSGGLISHANLTDDILGFTICHELGHLFGGHPHRPAPMEWPGPFDENMDMVLSAEGQADYYATLTCMRLVFADEDNVSTIGQMLIDPFVRKACDNAHPRSEDSAICQRSAMAGFGMLTLTYPFKIAFDTPAQEIAPSTIKGTYPSRQCRLDTVLAGALCSNDQTECSSRKGEAGFRPACWFTE